MDDKEKVWHRLKHGVVETEAETFQRLARVLFGSVHWEEQKEKIMKEYNLSTTFDPAKIAKQLGMKDV